MIGNMESKLKILAIHRYYWPDTAPYASILRSIVKRWTDDGHTVDVLSSQPSYKQHVELSKRLTVEKVDGALVYRLNLPFETARPIVRILNTIKLSAAILWRGAIKRRYDVIMISTSPPVIGGWVAALISKLTRARFIYHCMDIHPEIGRVSGEFKNSLIFNLLQRLDRYSCQVASPTVVLSNDMREVLQARDNSRCLDIEILNNFSVPSTADSNSSVHLPFDISEDKLTLIFAGNIGRFQGLEHLLEAFNQPILKTNKRIELILMGDGNRRQALESYASENNLTNVRFVGHHSVNTAKLAMQRADYGFVSLVPTLYRYAYPSKTTTYLEQGCPLLLAVEPESELAKELTVAGVGMVVSQTCPQILATEIASLIDLNDDREAKKDAARAYAQAHFSEKVLLPKWSELLLRNNKVE